MESQTALFDQTKNFKKKCQNPQQEKSLSGQAYQLQLLKEAQNQQFFVDQKFPRFKNFRLISLPQCIQNFRFYISMIRSKCHNQFPIMVKILYKVQDQTKNNKSQEITKKIKQFLVLVQNTQVVQKSQKEFYFYKSCANSREYRYFFQQIGNFKRINRKAIMLDMALQLYNDLDDDLLQDMMQIIDFS